MFWIAVAIFLMIAGWMWVKKPTFPAKLFFNAHPITYRDSRKRWIGVYAICLALLVMAGAYKPFVDWLLAK
jgi:hypothetical protein